MQIDQEFANIKTWSEVNKIPINLKKTKGLIIFQSSIVKESYRDKITPVKGVERVTETKLFGVLWTELTNLDSHA